MSRTEAEMPNPAADRAVEVLWVGGQGGMEVELVTRAGVPFEGIPAAGLHGVGLRALPGNLARLGRGYRQARRILAQYQPDVIFFTGGYVAGPVALAGCKVPSALYVPDIEPGLALKYLARFADRIAVTAQDSRRYFPDSARVQVSGYPVRSDLAGWERAAARKALSLQDDLPVLLVFGGSKGARSINRALLAILPRLLAEMQVVHISGNLDWPQVEDARHKLAETQEQRQFSRYHAYPYLHEEMGAALAAADLVVARAGASTLGEFPLFGLPALLVPYPHAWRYQHVNAEYLARRGAARIIEDNQLAAELLPSVLELMRSPSHRQQMAQAMRSLARPEAAASIAQMLLELGRAGRKGSAA